MNSSILVEKCLELLEKYLLIGSVIGYEQPFMKQLILDLNKLDLEVKESRDYIVAKTKNQSPFIFSTHIDRHGFVKNESGEVEYAAFHYLRTNKLKLPHEEREKIEKKIVEKINESKLNRDFLILKDENSTVTFVKQYTLNFFDKIGLRYVKDTIRGYNDFGCGNNNSIIRYDPQVDLKKIVFELLKKDPFFYYQLNPQIHSDSNHISAQLDNIISVVVVLVLLEHKLIDGTFIFTTLEEVGQSYKQLIQYCEEVDIDNKKLIILDTSPYDTFVDKAKGFLTLRYGDENGGFDTQLVDKLRSLLDNEGIVYDFKPSFMGKTELGRVSRGTNGKITGMTLQLPTINYHTSHETCQIEGLKNYLRAIIELNKIR